MRPSPRSGTAYGLRPPPRNSRSASSFPVSALTLRTHTAPRKADPSMFFHVWARFSAEMALLARVPVVRLALDLQPNGPHHFFSEFVGTSQRYAVTMSY